MKKLLSVICLTGVLATASSAAMRTGNNTVGNKKMSIVTNKSGLRYQIKKEGKQDGKVATKGNVVKVHYTGWLNDGTDNEGKKFDSSHDRHQPFQFALGGGMVIAGWDEGVQGMREGEIRRLYIPAALGYGSRGAGNIIPAHANLIFDVEFLG